MKNTVRLRNFIADDKYRLAEFANNENISRNLRDGFPNPYTLTDAENFLANILGKTTNQVFAIEYNDIYVGNIGLFLCSDVYQKSAEIGYLLDEQFWNKGIMTQAVNLICAYGFKELDIVRIHTGVFEYNKASQIVLEKCGFCKEGVFKKAIFKNGLIYDEIRYAKIKF